MSNTPPDTYVFLNPDGTGSVGLTVLVAAPTGVTYGHQCAGSLTEVRVLEGFAVPLATADRAEPLRAFFRRFHGYPPIRDGRTGAVLLDEHVAELARIVSAIPFWLTSRSGADERRLFLQLDRDREDELTEAWVPVQTVSGRGVLIFDNSD